MDSRLVVLISDIRVVRYGINQSVCARNALNFFTRACAKVEQKVHRPGQHLLASVNQDFEAKDEAFVDCRVQEALRVKYCIMEKYAISLKPTEFPYVL